MSDTIESKMNLKIVLHLQTDPDQAACLERLQVAFAEVCNVLGEVVRDTRCWNRVALHHLMYHRLRERFPALGSQMICNAIYSVSRTARLVFQSPLSPWSIEKRLGLPLPKMQFAPSAPVFFDRHTLSLKNGRLSMYTLDGRLRFEVGLSVENERRFREEKLKEILLTREKACFCLLFTFGEDEQKVIQQAELPQYVLLMDAEAVAA